jgi:hypothetical protein
MLSSFRLPSATGNQQIRKLAAGLLGVSKRAAE